MKGMNKEIIKNLPLELTFEVGRTVKDVEEITQLKKGSIIKLEDSKKDIIKLILKDKIFAEGKALRKNGVMYVEIKDLKGKGGKNDE